MFLRTVHEQREFEYMQRLQGALKKCSCRESRLTRATYAAILVSSEVNIVDVELKEELLQKLKPKYSMGVQNMDLRDCVMRFESIVAKIQEPVEN
jgi:hypothetical protein